MDNDPTRLPSYRSSYLRRYHPYPIFSRFLRRQMTVSGSCHWLIINLAVLPALTRSPQRAGRVHRWASMAWTTKTRRTRQKGPEQGQALYSL